MQTSTKKVSELTVEELKSVIHDVITEDMEIWRETFEILADKKLMKEIRNADEDWAKGENDAYLPWDELKNV
jgi:hypothetical protein